MLQLADNDFKVVILNMFKHLKENKFILREQMWNTNIYIQEYQNGNYRILKYLKLTFTRIISLMLEKGLERVSKFEFKSIALILTEEKRMI